MCPVGHKYIYMTLQCVTRSLSFSILTHSKVSSSHFFCHGIKCQNYYLTTCTISSPKTPRLLRISSILCFCRSYALCQRPPATESQPLTWDCCGISNINLNLQSLNFSTLRIYRFKNSFALIFFNIKK